MYDAAQSSMRQRTSSSDDRRRRHRGPRRAGPLRARAPGATLDAEPRHHAGRRVPTAQPRTAASPPSARGGRATDRSSASDDGYGDTTIHYTLAPGDRHLAARATGHRHAGAPGSASLRPDRADAARSRVDGPDALTSDAYTADYDEVARCSAAPPTRTVRTQRQTDTAQFFNSNSATMVGDALVRLPRGPTPLSLLRTTAWLFAADPRVP